MPTPITVVGGGLAGSEAVRVLAAAGEPVRLVEMRPVTMTPAHHTGGLAEIVCSNSLGSTNISTGKGVLLAEMERLGSLVVACARRAAVPAGASLAVDREQFSGLVSAAIEQLPGVEVVRAELRELPAGDVLVATGPLTSDALAAAIAEVTGATQLSFYDAVAPIVSAESLDHDVIYAASRYGKGEPDFLNCPLNAEQYDHFVDELLAAESVPAHDFEKPTWFEGCMPVEVMAERGRRTLAFGPMRPVGLDDPRTGRRPYAVVQLRREDAHGRLYNLVGFQTKLRYAEQKRVFRLIPGLERAEFVRLGSIHRNTFLNTPALLTPGLSLESRPDLWFGGLLVGVEGYAECAATGIMAALSILARRRGDAIEPPPATTMIGGLLAFLRQADPAHFQPMNVNFGLLPPLDEPLAGKRERRAAMGERALAAMDAWIAEHALHWLTAPTGRHVESNPG